MLHETRAFARIAHTVDPQRAIALEPDVNELFGSGSVEASLALLLATAYPPFAITLFAHPEHIRTLAHVDLSQSRSFEDHQAALAALKGEGFRRSLRLYTVCEKMRIALRELLPHSLGGADIEASTRELSELADATIQAAFSEAYESLCERFGRPYLSTGEPSGFVVMGMGKLGGRELNAGSDVDLIFFYDSDAGEVRREGELEANLDAPSIHEFWQRVAKRLTATLEALTEDGQVWRVDLRLRPDGASGALVLPIVSIERYYESFGRLWERAALIRARPVAGSLALGEEILEILTPFVWRKRIDPTLARELHQLVRRSRIELCSDPERDLKLGPGGIREAEFFVQTLQLVWGGKDATVRSRPTLAALRQLEARGLVTEGETRDITDGYLLLRRAEHAVQWVTGVQTHSLPLGDDLERIARILGFKSALSLLPYLESHRRRVEQRFASLLPEEAGADDEWGEMLVSIEQRDHQNLALAVRKRLPNSEDLPSDDEGVLRLAASLLELGAHPDAPLGPRTQESSPGFVDSLLSSLFDAVDPVQAASYLRVFFARIKQQAVYVRLLAGDPPALRRLISLLGASSFVGDALCNNPDLGDMILFQRDLLTEGRVRADVRAALEVEPAPDEDPAEALIGALRLAKTRLTLEVAVHDLSSAYKVADVNALLSTLAETALACSIERALPGCRGLSILAMGKLGGREISYGSDLDVVFVFEPTVLASPEDAPYHFAKIARRVIRTISTFHGAGPGYELDARLRPSGNQGLLVTSLDSLASYHGVGSERSGPRAQVWERMALVRARFVAGDAELGERAESLMRTIAFGPAPPRAAAQEIRRVRERVLLEMAREKEGRFDIKLGRGGLLELEFVVQFNQLLHGHALGGLAQSRDTKTALVALTEGGAISQVDGAALSEAHTFLRRLEARVRVSRADAAHVLDTRHASLETLARRMGLRGRPFSTAGQELVARYREHTEKVRAIYERVFVDDAG